MDREVVDGGLALSADDSCDSQVQRSGEQERRSGMDGVGFEVIKMRTSD